MTQYLETLQQQLADYQIQKESGEDLPILELLWYCYFQENPVDDGAIRRAELELRPAFEALDLQSSDALFDMIDDLVSKYQRAAFFDGFHTGIQLAKELHI